MARQLIVNADDYGLAPSVSAGIRYAHQHGLVTSTTAMMNQPGVAAELERALAECPRLGLGVHLVLTKGRPLLPPNEISSLVALGEAGCFPSLSHLLPNLAALDPPEVQAEWQAQIAAFVRATGQRPTHLDSHHHSAYASPPLFAALLALAKEFGCAIRWPLTRHDPSQAHLGVGPAQQGHLEALAGTAHVRHPDRLDTRFYGDGVSTRLLREIIATLPAGITELMCHPGFPDQALTEVSSYHQQRVKEMEALTAAELQPEAAHEGVAFVSFGHLSEE